MSSFSLMTTMTATVWAPQRLEDGKRGAEEKLAMETIKIMPIATLDPETRLRLNLQSPLITLQTYLENNPRLKDGYEIVPAQGEYIGRRLTIRNISRWPWPDGDIKIMLALELVKP